MPRLSLKRINDVPVGIIIAYPRGGYIHRRVWDFPLFKRLVLWRHGL